MFSCTPESLKQVLSSHDECLAPEIQMAVTKPETNRPIRHVISQEHIKIFKKFQNFTKKLHLGFQLCLSSESENQPRTGNSQYQKCKWQLPKPKVSVVLVISLEPTEIFKKFQRLHLCFRLCPGQPRKYQPRTGNSQHWKCTKPAKSHRKKRTSGYV